MALNIELYTAKRVQKQADSNQDKLDAMTSGVTSSSITREDYAVLQHQYRLLQMSASIQEQGGQFALEAEQETLSSEMRQLEKLRTHERQLAETQCAFEEAEFELKLATQAA